MKGPQPLIERFRLPNTFPITSTIMSKLTLPIPDLRFENTFKKSLRSYATALKPGKQTSNEKLLAQSEPEPIGPITSGVVLYAIAKDQILMQFLQGFGTAVFFMLVTPYLKYLVKSGRRWGIYAKAKILGVAGDYGFGKSSYDARLRYV